MVPGLQPTILSRTASPPAQRSATYDIWAHGTAILDEFLLPSSPEHCLNAQGLQGLCTGDKINPGRALENDKGFGLKFPLFMTCKVNTFPVDFVGRLCPLLFDVLDENSRKSGAELSFVTSGMAAMVLRLGTLRYIYANHLIPYLRKRSAGDDKVWRFPAHCRVAELLTGSFKGVPATEGDVHPGDIDYTSEGQDLAALKEYFDRATVQMAKQLNTAQASGLTDEIGASPRLNPAWHFEHCSEMTLEQLFQEAQLPDNILSPQHVLKAIIEDKPQRDFHQVLRTNCVRESAALQQFVKLLKAEKFVRDAWEMSYVSKEQSDKRNKYRTTVPYIKLLRAGAATGKMDGKTVFSL